MEVGTILMGLLGGLALFLYGMDKLTHALKRAAGERIKSLLARMTTNRFKAVFAGAFITAVIQSSSVTTVLVVGFISAGLLSLSQSIGVIMGASIGTTITAQVIAFKVTEYSLLLVAAGFGTMFLVKRDTVRQYGRMAMGLGLIFFGMQLMKEATSPLKDYAPFVEAMRNLHDPLLAILFSALFTGIVQSSSATTGVIIVLASQGFITLEAGIPLVFGANVGTCVTALLAAIGKPREAVRAALVHVLFNVAGVALWFGLIPYLAEFIRWISPVTQELSGVARLKADTPRQIANAHTAFNVTNTLVFIGLTPVIARLVEWVVPDRQLAASGAPHRRYLDDILVHTPALAIDVVRMELARLGASTLRMVKGCMTPVLQGTREDLDALRAMDDEVDELHGALITYLGRLSGENLTEPQTRRLSEYIAATNYFENIGDMIETNLVDAGHARLAGGLHISPGTQERFQALHDKVVWAVEQTTSAIASDDKEMARAVMDAKSDISRLADEADARLAQRLTAAEPNRLQVYRLESELVEALKRVYYFAKRIAKLVLEEAASFARTEPPAGDDPPDEHATEEQQP